MSHYLYLAGMDPDYALLDELITKLLDDTLSPTEKTVLALWLDEDTTHRIEFIQRSKMLRKLRRVARGEIAPEE